MEVTSKKKKGSRPTGTVREAGEGDAGTMATAVRQPRLTMANIVILIRDFSHRQTDQ